MRPEDGPLKSCNDVYRKAKEGGIVFFWVLG